MTAPVIDLWNVSTFDTELRSLLDGDAEEICYGLEESKRREIEREKSRSLPIVLSSQHRAGLLHATEKIAILMEQRVVRGWHYSRMTADEVSLLRVGGIQVSTPDSLRMRLSNQVQQGTISQAVADQIFSRSPINGNQFDARNKKFWMISHPTPVSDAGVEPLLESWGGEVVYFWQKDLGVRKILKELGTPRVLEVAAPLSHTRHSYSAAEVVVATYAKHFGWPPEKSAIDFYICKDLGPEHIINIHSEGETLFASIAKGYPADFVTS